MAQVFRIEEGPTRIQRRKWSGRTVRVHRRRKDDGRGCGSVRFGVELRVKEPPGTSAAPGKFSVEGQGEWKVPPRPGPTGREEA